MGFGVVVVPDGDVTDIRRLHANHVAAVRHRMSAKGDAPAGEKWLVFNQDLCQHARAACAASWLQPGEGIARLRAPSTSSSEVLSLLISVSVPDELS